MDEDDDQFEGLGIGGLPDDESGDDYVPGGPPIRRESLIARAAVIVPLRRCAAPAHVYIDEGFYASFKTVESAEDAAFLFEQRWAAVKDRRVHVVRG